MKQKEISRTFMVISNWQKTFGQGASKKEGITVISRDDVTFYYYRAYRRQKSTLVEVEISTKDYSFLEYYISWRFSTLCRAS